MDAATVAVETNMTFHQRENRVIVADSDIPARMIFGATLADDDVAGDHMLAAELLDAPALTVAVTAVATTALAFLVCHDPIDG